MSLRNGSNPAPTTARPPAPPAPPSPVRIAAERLGQAEHEARRFEAAKAALTGLLAATPATTQAASNTEQYARSAVRYADALLDALNRTTAESMTHARQR
ncbi:hypothetical protein EAH75_04450 [Rhodanobacter glycinis]|uniref:hypothetical protein n=1 Tax=Rhodanobacter glycinis TaxID=582702 RepID=UPI00112EC048|nr:hypothetical protein [Rhodanobacter glycinis]TPG50695.1 hypothetical protein EAH75_04450 [Rhodanobacter glycinis]